jgi:membrane-bound inhibitor of C-type lysozyme
LKYSRRIFFLSLALLSACGKRTVTYHCKEGTEFTVVYTKEHAQVQVQNKVFELPQVTQASGVKYSDGAITLGTKGSTAFLLDADQMIDYGCEEK